MRRIPLALLSVLLAAPLTSYANEQLMPAGSLIQCTVSEGKLNSKTTAIGDPVLCRISHAARYGHTMLPYDSYLVGRFEDYRDPGHFYGKGWMQLTFDRLVIEPDTMIPITARVVGVPGYNVDHYGRILGKGHATRDTVEWMIPILWPIDLINLPRRGPRPTLKEETRVTVKLMDDIGIPDAVQPAQDPSGLYRRPSAYTPPPAPAPAPAPVSYVAPAPVTYVAPPPPPVYYYVPQPVMAYAPPPPRYVVLYRGGMAYRQYIPY
jgi:hypothetical protein